MSSQTDLNSYLEKFVQRNAARLGAQPPKPAELSRDNSRAHVSHVSFNSENNVSAMSANTALCFQRAQIECIEELEELRGALAEEEKSLALFLQGYNQSLLQKVHAQHTSIRDEFIKMIHAIFETNAKRIDQALLPKLQQQPIEIANIRQQIAELTSQIERLQQGLKSQKYKKVIAEVVTSDFGTCFANLQNRIKDARESIGQKSYNLTLNVEFYKRIQEDLMNMYVIEQMGPSPINCPRPYQVNCQNDGVPRFGSSNTQNQERRTICEINQQIPQGYPQKESVFENTMNMLHLKREANRNKSLNSTAR